MRNDDSLDTEKITRRLFIGKGIAVAGSFLASAASVHAAKLAVNIPTTQINVDDLRKSIKGAVFTRADANFESIAYGDLWNQLRPKRFPQVVVKINDDKDVIEVVKFAKANKLKISVRGGGHNWCSPSLRNNGIMIDLGNMTKVISIDPVNRKAIVEPIISNREIQKQLNAQGLAYPSGHCPPVKLSGYLLSGGMSWNQGVWGPGVGSVEAIEMVTSDGELITASKDQNQDYFWAARGVGSGSFFVAVRYHLKLYPLPKAITWSSYFFHPDHLVPVSQWVSEVASKLPPLVEFSLFLVPAPPELKEKCASAGGKIAMVTATAFADTEGEAKESLSPLEACPLMDKCLKKSFAEPANFEMLFDASGSLWPGDLRAKVDAIFSNAKLEDLMTVGKDRYIKTPSEKTVYMFAVMTGKDVPAPLLDTSFSMSARFYGGPWTMWEKESDDAANIAWHEDIVKAMKPLIHGHYVSETDTVAHPEFAKQSYLPRNWERLTALRKKYDPQGVFFNYTDGLS